MNVFKNGYAKVYKAETPVAEPAPAEAPQQTAAETPNGDLGISVNIPGPIKGKFYEGFAYALGSMCAAYIWRHTIEKENGK